MAYADKEKEKAMQKRNRLKNKVAIRARNVAFYQTHKEYNRERLRAWRKKNPNKVKAQQQVQDVKRRHKATNIIHELFSFTGTSTRPKRHVYFGLSEQETRKQALDQAREKIAST